MELKPKEGRWLDPVTKEGLGVLVLTRKVGESIAIGDDVKIVVMQIKGKQVRLGIKASPNTVVHREEVYQRIQDENRRAAEAAHGAPLDQAGELLRGTSDGGQTTVLRRHNRGGQGGGGTS